MYTLAQISDFLGVIGWFAAGFWFIREHLVKRADYPKINVSADVKELAIIGPHRIIEISAQVQNSGDVRHIFKRITYSVRGSRLDDVRLNVRSLGQVDLPVVVARDRDFFPASWEYSFVDAGQISTYKHLIAVPACIKLLRVGVKMKYSDSASDFHSASWHGVLGSIDI